MTPTATHRIRLLGLLVAALIPLVMSTASAQAATCSGTLGPVLSERGREYPLLSFHCDVPIGGNFHGRLFQVAFSDRGVTTLKEPKLGAQWLEDYVGQCDAATPAGADPSRAYVECTALTDTQESVVVKAGTTITGTPWNAEAEIPVCPTTAEVTVFDADAKALATFPLRSTCPPGWKVKQQLTVVVLGGGGTVTGEGISCRGTCTYLYPIGAAVSLRASPDRGATFVRWGDGCSGTARCSLTLDDDLEVAAVFNGGATPVGKIRPAVDGPAFVRGTTVVLTLGCRGPTGSTCTILTALTTTERVQGTRVIAVSARTTKKVVTLAKRTYTIKAGAQKTVSLALSATGRSLLQRFRTLPVRVTATLTSAPKPTVFYSTALRIAKP